MNKKCGIISIVGRSNVGKSTLFNAIIGKKISIISKKINTTRSKILGIKTNKNTQMIFIDTPGIISNKSKDLNDFIKKQIKASLEISQIILFMVEALKFTKEDKKILFIIKNLDYPIVLVVNKIDLLKNNVNLILPFIKKVSSEFNFQAIVPLIAIKKKMILNIENILENLIPENDFLFEKNKITDKNKIFFIKEIIREKIIKIYDKEIPYNIFIELEKIRKKNDTTYIDIILYVNNIYKKKIIIGNNGNKIKLLLNLCSCSIEKYLKTKINLNLFIKIKNI